MPAIHQTDDAGDFENYIQIKHNTPDTAPKSLCRGFVISMHFIPSPTPNADPAAYLIDFMEYKLRREGLIP